MVSYLIVLQIIHFLACLLNVGYFSPGTLANVATDTKHLTSGCTLRIGVATLNHKVLNHTMEQRPIITSLLCQFQEIGVGEEMIHAICSHGYGHVDVKPKRLMEKVLFTTDELTGLIWAAALMRPSKSVQDMELKSLKKKYKSKGFAAGCSREVIEQGAEMLGWSLDEVLQKTLDAMRDCEAHVASEMEKI